MVPSLRLGERCRAERRDIVVGIVPVPRLGFSLRLLKREPLSVELKALLLRDAVKNRFARRDDGE